MPRKIHWHGLSERDRRQCGDNCDLYTKRPHGTWDIMHGVDGWVIKPPVYWKTLRDEHRIVLGHITRDEARIKAEALIQADEA